MVNVELPHHRRPGVQEPDAGSKRTGSEEPEDRRRGSLFSGTFLSLLGLEPEGDNVDLGRARAGGLGTCTPHRGE